MCIDFTSLNVHCPEDHCSFPVIDQLVEATPKYKYLSFLDVKGWYHQVYIYLNDALKTTFTTSDIVYYYVRMSFDLKNVGVTFQRLMNEVFAPQVGRNLEAYISSTIVKSMTFEDHLKDLKVETPNHALVHCNLISAMWKATTVWYSITT